MNLLEQAWENLKNSTEDDIQKEIDALKETVLAPVTGIVDQTKKALAQAPEAAASVNNISAFLDTIKKNALLGAVVLSLVVFVIVKMLSKKSGR